MNRRRFFKRLSVAALGLVALPEQAAWKSKTETWLLNPEWATAPYEVQFVNGMHGMIAKCLHDHSPWLSKIEGGTFPHGAGETIRSIK